MIPLLRILSFIPLRPKYRKRWEADNIQGERRNYIFDLDHNIFGEEGPIQNQYSVDGYTKGSLFSLSQSRFSHLDIHRELGSLYQVSDQMRWQPHALNPISHSCDPNMQVLPTMFDAPEVRLRSVPLNVTDRCPSKIEKSYLVFVAIKDIREGVELTIDYHPNLGIPTKGKGKRKRKGSDTCMCDAKLCRGTRP